ncbi:protein far1-related sequence 5-like [Gigaspora margarita]|uniref:Protein far1-related sequence 5-like n=1 Tax=Gigaspora margarita TaxID=4874 RepID=A0A8H4B4F8_GIGMA|nr:protein far1-related sequence 5-like [Gigaspora margarita]
MAEIIEEVDANYTKYTNTSEDTSIAKAIEKVNAEYMEYTNATYNLFVNEIDFEANKKIISEIINDVNNSTQRFLEKKYPAQLIYSKDLYIAIKKFQSTTKTLLNNVALMSNWLNSQKEHNPQ